MRILAVAVLSLAIMGCSNSRHAHHALTAQGFTDIETTGWSPMTCSEDDTFATGFIATNPQGVKVKGTVCSGLFIKGATIRW